MRFKGIKRERFILPAAAVLIPTLILCSVRWVLPDDITLVEGEKTEITLQLPVSARTEESVGVLGITTKPLADAFHLEMGSAVTAEPFKTGKTEVTFYLLNALPVKTVEATVISAKSLVPVGQTVGISVDTKGILVLGTAEVENEQPCKGIIRSGDLLQMANGGELKNKEALQAVTKESKGKPIEFLLERDGKKKTVTVTPIWSEEEQTYRLGLWVRDSIQGIGTVTYYDPDTGEFGALGHGVYDVDTGEMMVIKRGTVLSSKLTDIVKGQKGEPGELTGILEKDNVLGSVAENTDVGIYGELEDKPLGEEVPIGLKQEAENGRAYILSNIEGDEVKKYEIMIKAVERGKGKDMEITVTDKELLEKTGGIVQGMSGSPIIQKGKLIGAVTHVLVNDPSRGYGIWIENMLGR